MRLLGNASRGVIVERNSLTIDDGVVEAAILGVLSHDLRIGRPSSGWGIDDLGDVFGKRTIGVVPAEQRHAGVCAR